ncbi:uncharacterized protein E6C27_scaffold316G001600 [Cucumis melo var. makuwa]|uniref:Reverse transcriptase domain-containing protein n=1 Tax=Cucumis melo var. makuwa TaxID=1194695 RepID=A0A5A7TPA6_CUCMM|nr:uncharacterized protein E6C27_scaffold316G001600 [Cucumis melo var. makuwa]
MMIRLGGWSGLIDFMVVKMDDFDVVLGMEFLLEHQVIPMPLAKCLVINGSAPSVVQTDLRQPDGLKMISAMQLKKGLTRDKPTFMAIPLDQSENPGETVLKDILMIDHEIELVSGAKPPAKNAYRMTPPELVELRKQLDELLNVGFIRLAKAPYGAPILFQKNKKDESLRLCIDYCALDKLTIHNKYPITIITYLFDRLHGAKYFSKLDLWSGYYQVFHEYLDKFVVVYLDDIVVYSSTMEEDRDHLQKVFQKLKENNLSVKIEKCSFAQERINFLSQCDKVWLNWDGRRGDCCDM